MKFTKKKVALMVACVLLIVGIPSVALGNSVHNVHDVHDAHDDQHQAH